MRGIPEGGDAKRGIPMADMTPPPMAEGVTMPDNPYTRMLESITQGRGTVSLPPPVPIPDEPLPDLVEDAIEPNVSNVTRRPPVSPAPHPRVVFSPATGFQGIDLLSSAVISDGDEAFLMTPAEIEEANQLCCRVIKRTLTDQIASIEKRLAAEGRAGKPKRGPRKKAAP